MLCEFLVKYEWIDCSDTVTEGNLSEYCLINGEEFTKKGSPLAYRRRLIRQSPFIKKHKGEVVMEEKRRSCCFPVQGRARYFKYNPPVLVLLYCDAGYTGV
jgi:hypothetical protein